MKQSRIEFIKRAHAAACSEWKMEIENEFPKIFKSEFKAGDWVVDNSAGQITIERITSIEDGVFKMSAYGDDDNGYYTTSECFRKATKEEVEAHLISQAKERGLDKFRFDSLKENGNLNVEDINTWFYDDDRDTLYAAAYMQGGKIAYKNGKWAEIIKETISKERAEELLEHKYQIA